MNDRFCDVIVEVCWREAATSGGSQAPFSMSTVVVD
jgi:hypothetical protein